MFTVMKFKVFFMYHWSWYSFTAHKYIFAKLIVQ
jgi:hypothetical protein